LGGFAMAMLLSFAVNFEDPNLIPELIRLVQQLTGLLLGMALAINLRQFEAPHYNCYPIFIGVVAVSFAAEWLHVSLNAQLLRYAAGYCAALIVLSSRHAIVYRFFEGVLVSVILIFAYESKSYGLMPFAAIVYREAFIQGSFSRWAMTKALASTVVSVVVGLLILFTISPSRFDDLVNPTESISSTARASLLLGSLNAIADKPIIGHGPTGFNNTSTFASYYRDSEALLLLIDAGLTRSHEYSGEDVSYSPGAHNAYTDVAVSYGGLGLLLFLYILFKSHLNITRYKPNEAVAAAFVVTVMSGLSWQYSSTDYGLSVFAFCYLSSMKTSQRRII
jgi:O-antigen ligase